MNRLARIAAGVWEFVVGDDWLTAVGVAVAIGVTAVIAAAGTPAWWVMPIAVLVLLAASLRRAH
ncbi:MAG TPA: hypothetical protein VGH45_09325 [Solirubrobacteraceae bacterium]|jgi:hypothetical protein